MTSHTKNIWIICNTNYSLKKSLPEKSYHQLLIPYYSTFSKQIVNVMLIKVLVPPFWNYLVLLGIDSIVCTHERGGGGRLGLWSNLQKGELDRISTLRRGWLFQGGCCYIKKLKSKLFIDKKKFMNKKVFLCHN